MTLARVSSRRAGVVRLFVVAFALAAGGAALTSTACQGRFVDLGTNDAAVGAPAAEPVADAASMPSLYGCAELSDPDAITLRAGACGGQCASVPGSPYDLASKRDLLAAVAGQWSFCEGSFGPPDAIGVELAPGCRLFFLRHDSNGAVVRGVEARFQATYDIYDPRPAGSTGRIDVHFDDRTTVPFEVEAYRCPEHLRLRGPRGAIELAPDFGDGGRPNPNACLRRPHALTSGASAS